MKKICKDCGGLGSVPVDLKTPGNHKRCQACNGSGITGSPTPSTKDPALVAGVADPGRTVKNEEPKTKNIQKEN